VARLRVDKRFAFVNEMQGFALREMKINFHELTYGHELQSKALHCGNITIMQMYNAYIAIMHNGISSDM
jgi:hypothetical protein